MRTHLKPFSEEDYVDWPGAEPFREMDPAPLVAEHSSGFFVVASRDVVGVYPIEDPNEGFWIATEVGARRDVVKLARLVVRTTELTPDVLRSLGFEPDD